MDAIARGDILLRVRVVVVSPSSCFFILNPIALPSLDDTSVWISCDND